MRSMSRWLTMVAAVSSALPLAAGPVAATSPDRGLPPHEVADTFVAPAGEHCGFDVGVEVSGKSGILLFDDQAIILSPGQKVTLTNLASPNLQVTYNVAGPGRGSIQWHEDGTATLVQVSTGPWIYFLPGRPILLTHGRVVETVMFDASGGVIDVELDTTTATTTDVCAVLS